MPYKGLLLYKYSPSLSLTKEKGTRPADMLPKSLSQIVVKVKTRRPLCVASKAAILTKTLVNEGRPSKLSYLGSLYSPYKNLPQKTASS